MAEITWKSILTKLVGGDHLSAEESEWFVVLRMPTRFARTCGILSIVCSSTT